MSHRASKGGKIVQQVIPGSFKKFKAREKASTPGCDPVDPFRRPLQPPLAQHGYQANQVKAAG